MKITLFFLTTQACIGFASNSALLTEIEKHYRSAHSVEMVVEKNLKLKLFDKERKSTGTIKIKEGGLLRWETTEPNHSLVVSDGKFIWLVDYQPDEEEKPNIIKATRPKKSQPHAIVGLLLGKGRITDDFKITGEKPSESGHTSFDLKPKSSSQDQVKWLKLVANNEQKCIDSVSFEDNLGNVTELNFKDIHFDHTLESSLFKFSPPKGADITVLR